MLTIKTDNKWKNFKYRYEVPEKVLADQFDYQDDDEVSDGFFCYKKQWYHLDEFMRIEHNPDSAFKKWHAYSSDTYFSGIVIKVSNDGEQYMIGRYYS